MPVLAAIGFIIRIVLILLLVLFGLLLLLLCIRVGVEATGANGDMIADLRYGVLHIPVFPLKKRKKTTKEKKRKTTEKSAEKSQKRKRKLDFSTIDIMDTLDHLMSILSDLTGNLRISNLQLRLLLGTEDNAKTGMLLGSLSAVFGVLTPFLENTFDMRDYHISVDADFDATKTKWAFTVFASLRPIQAIWILLRYRKPLWHLYKQIVKKEEAIPNE